MKQLHLLPLLLAAFLATSATALASDPIPSPLQHGPGFVDLNGDGFNDNAPDFDGDGIPNGLDEDWVAPQDGTGYMHSWAAKRMSQHRWQNNTTGTRFVDENGDGICDNQGTSSGYRRGLQQGVMQGQGKMFAGMNGQSSGMGHRGGHSN